MNGLGDWLMRILLVESWAGVWLALFGLTAQTVFMGRMLVQWIASERARASVVPELFWWMSLVGAAMLLAYGIMRRDIVIIAAQMFGFGVYARNLWFIRFVARRETQGQEGG
ncbi:MAG: lipid-A-disaccharide synthase N-terminal domain-containing protein [Pseudomonadota bacterium]